MTRAEVEKLLIVASAVDNRVVTEMMIDAWLAAIGDFAVSDAVAALNAFRKVATTEYLVPGHITQHIKIARQEYRDLHGFSVPAPAGKRWAVDAIENDPQYGAHSAITSINEQEDRSDPSNNCGA